MGRNKSSPAKAADLFALLEPWIDSCVPVQRKITSDNILLVAPMWRALQKCPKDPGNLSFLAKEMNEALTKIITKNGS
eukprot:12722502-Alexandrium_andersonii.AAC.1